MLETIDKSVYLYYERLRNVQHILLTSVYSTTHSNLLLSMTIIFCFTLCKLEISRKLS